MPLPDPAASQVVLIGTSRYRDPALADLPSVRHNLERLREVVTTPGIWGVPATNVTVVGDDLLGAHGGAQQAVRLTRAAADRAQDALVVYYSGHGLPNRDDDDDDLYLALPDSDQDEPASTALPFEELRRKVNASYAQRKVIILDCCSSGLALGGRLSALQVPGSPILPGMAVLTATRTKTPALAPRSGEMTMFTAELVAILVGGLPRRCGCSPRAAWTWPGCPPSTPPWPPPVSPIAGRRAGCSGWTPPSTGSWTRSARPATTSSVSWPGSCPGSPRRSTRRPAGPGPSPGSTPTPRRSPPASTPPARTRCAAGSPRVTGTWSRRSGR